MCPGQGLWGSRESKLLIYGRAQTMTGDIRETRVNFRVHHIESLTGLHK